jgi:ABC-type amino acid transport substrate-binding protein
MATALAKTFGATAKPLKTAFPGLIPALKAKKCNAVISGIFVTPDRLKQAGAARYVETHRVFVVKARQPEARHWSELEPPGPERCRPGGDEVRGVPEGAPEDDRLQPAELSG